MDDELKKRARERAERYRRDMDTAPSASEVLAAVERFNSARPLAIGEWTMVAASETPRHLVVLVIREHETGYMDREWIFERVGGEWRSRGGSGGSGAPAPDRRPGPGEAPICWLGLTTLYPHGRWQDTGLAGPAVLRLRGGWLVTSVVLIAIRLDALLDDPMAPVLA